MANSAIDQVVQMLKLNTLDQNQSLVFVQQKTGLRPSQISLAIIVFILIVLIFAQAAAFLISIVCFFGPAYLSVFNLSKNNIKEDTKYITYWVIFGVLQTLQPLILLILSSSFYTFFRIGFSICLLHPQIDLSTIFYQKLIRHQIEKSQGKITLHQIASVGDKKYEDFKEMNIKILEEK